MARIKRAYPVRFQNFKKEVICLREAMRRRIEAERVLHECKEIEGSMSTRLLKEVKRRRIEVQQKVKIYSQGEIRILETLQRIREKLASTTDSDEVEKKYRTSYDLWARNLSIVINLRIKLTECRDMILEVENRLNVNRSSSDAVDSEDDE